MLNRSEVITNQSGCPVCYGELDVHQEFPEQNSLPITSKCNNCGLYQDSYHGMGDSTGRVGDFFYGWSDQWDEQGYLSAILAARKYLKEGNDGKENLYSF